MAATRTSSLGDVATSPGVALCFNPAQEDEVWKIATLESYCLLIGTDYTCSSHLLLYTCSFPENLFLLEVGSSRWCYVHQQCPDVMKVNVYQILDPWRFITDQPWTFVVKLCKKNQVHENVCKREVFWNDL